MKIEFVIPTYNRPYHLMAIVSSIMAQTSPLWTIHIVNDCGPVEPIENIIKFYNDDRIRCTTLSQRMNDFGHSPRQLGLDECQEELVVLSGEDNYYVPTFVEEFLKVYNDVKDVNFVFCNMIHNWTRQQYVPIDSKPEYGKIDIGNVVLRTQYTKYVKLNTKVSHADWLYFEEYIKKFCKNNQPVKINKYLYVHN